MGYVVFLVQDVAGWPNVEQQPQGRRAKMWIAGPDGRRWLRKNPLARSDAEPAIERFTLWLAAEFGIRAPEAHLCTWLDGTELQRGLIVLNFVDRGEISATGAEAIRAIDPTFDATNHWQHTLDRALDVATELPRGRDEFLQLLFFDAWIGNRDRHSENWSVLESAAGRRLAPIYDTASCLGSELQASSVAGCIRRTPRYILACPSGFGDGSNPLRMDQLVTLARRTSEWASSIGSWLARAEAVRDRAAGTLRACPPDWLSAERCELAVKLLEERLEWLSQ
jgi:hypothetical protein